MYCVYRYTGVTWFRGKWEAYFSVADQHGNKTIKKLVGHFSSEVAAAVATDRARVLNVSGMHSDCHQILCWACTVHEWQMHPCSTVPGTVCCYKEQLAVTGHNLLLLGTTCCYRVQTAVTGYNLLLQFVSQGTQVHPCHAKPHLEGTLHKHRKGKHCLHSTRGALHCGTAVCRPVSSETIQLRPEAPTMTVSLCVLVGAASCQLPRSDAMTSRADVCVQRNFCSWRQECLKKSVLCLTIYVCVI